MFFSSSCLWFAKKECAVETDPWIQPLCLISGCCWCCVTSSHSRPFWERPGDRYGEGIGSGRPHNVFQLLKVFKSLLKTHLKFDSDLSYATHIDMLFHFLVGSCSIYFLLSFSKLNISIADKLLDLLISNSLVGWHILS